MRLKTALLLAPLALTTACIIVIDDEGLSTSGFAFSQHNHASNHGPRIIGSGQQANETRTLAHFETVKLIGSLDLEVTIVPGLDQNTISLSGDDNIIEHVRTSIEDGALEVRLKDGNYSWKTPLTIHARASSLAAAQLTGSGDLIVNNLMATNFDLTLTGSGDIAIAGQTTDLRIGLSGSGDIDAKSLTARNASVKLAGSGDVTVNATEQLDVKISGSGEVGYKGGAQTNTKINGSGEIYPIN